MLREPETVLTEPGGGRVGFHHGPTGPATEDSVDEDLTGQDTLYQ